MDKEAVAKSKKKQAIIQCLHKGMTAKEIGKKMGMSNRTVEFHIRELHKTYKVNKTTLLVALTLQEKLKK